MNEPTLQALPRASMCRWHIRQSRQTGTATQANGLRQSPVVHHTDLGLPKDIWGVCKLRGTPVVTMAQDITDLTCVSVFKLTCQQ